MIKISKFHTEQIVDTIHEYLIDSMKDLYKADVPLFEKKVQAVWDKYLKSSDRKILQKYNKDLNIGEYLKMFHKDLSARYSYNRYGSCSKDLLLNLVRVDEGNHTYYPRNKSCEISKAKIKSELVKQSLLLSDETKLMNTVYAVFLKEIENKYKRFK